MEASPRPWATGKGVAFGAGALVLVAALAAAVDMDLDGDPTFQELRSGTRPWDADTDGDRLHDGWERQAGLDPRSVDGDGDGLRDDLELRLGADPTSADSDGDGLDDGAEATLPDCDGDGAGSIAEGDGDADGRLDSLEDEGDRCVADADADGVRDGAEGNAACVHDKDCDKDGLEDGNETDGFDALDPDSFGSGVADSVSYAFQESGQPPGADADDDGIPDGWEGDDGLIAWGDLRPQVGQRDLLVEFLRVQGPDSGLARYSGVSFAQAYTYVADALRAERGLHMRWTETVVTIAAESDPQLIPQLEDPYYANVLAKGRHSGNPYVTTVVMNPQHDQSQLLHAGVAPIRGMLAAIDYGAHVEVSFSSASGNVTARMQPIVESMIRGGRQDLLGEMGFRGGYTTAQDMGLEAISSGNRLIWTPSWFKSNMRLVAGTTSIPLSFTGVTVFHGSLAGTIMHELGHTLGLCHSHDTDCNAKFSAYDRAHQADSIMSYDNPGNTLHYLDSEWTTVLQYVSCPPDAPVTLVAQGAPMQQVLEAKYGYANKDVLSVDLRTCNDLTPVQRMFQPGVPPATTYQQPSDMLDPPAGAGGIWLTAGFLVLAAGAVAAATVFGGRWRPSS